MHRLIATAIVAFALGTAATAALAASHPDVTLAKGEQVRVLCPVGRIAQFGAFGGHELTVKCR